MIHFFKTFTMKQLAFTILLLFLHFNVFSQQSSLYLRKNFFQVQYVVDDHEVRKREFKSVLKTNPLAIKKYRYGSFQIGTGAVLLTGGFVLLIGIDSNSPNNPPYWWQWMGIPSMLSGAFLQFTGVKTQLAAVDLYNDMRLSLNTNFTGIELSFSF